MSQSWSRLLRPAAARPRPAAATRRRTRRALLTAEPLEGRALLAVLSVNPAVNASRVTGDQSEPTIAINPTNPLNVVVLSNENDRSGVFYGVSFDGGLTFTSQNIANGSDGLVAACCDPVASFDAFGNLFVVNLDGNLSGATVLLSTNGGQSFSVLTTITDARDQPKVVTGPGGSVAAGSVWVEYADSVGGISAVGAPVTALGQVGAFTGVQRAPGSGGGNFGKPGIGPDGQLIISYQNPSGGQGPAVLFAHTDPDGLGPQGFGPAVRISDTNVGGFDFIPGQSVRSVDSEVEVVFDNSDGPFRGRAYAIYADEVPANESSDLDVFVRISDDDGATWGPRIRVNDDATTNAQFLQRIAVDPTTGIVGATWYDSRLDGGSGANDTDGQVATDAIVFASVSLDGGLTWEPNVQVGLGPSNPNAAGNNSRNDYGDYTGISFYGNVLRTVWTDNSTALPGNPARPSFDIATASIDIVLLTVQGTTFTAAENVAFNGQVATFTDSDAGAVAGDFTATISWGDGTPDTPGTIVAGTGGGFSVRGTHTYDEGGSRPTLVTVTKGGTLTSTGAGTANVASAPIVVTGGFVFQGPEDTTISGRVATITDADPAPPTADRYEAVIDWGDNTSSLGTVTALGGGVFAVDGEHTYTEGSTGLPGGSYTITITATEPGGNVSSGTSLATIGSAPIDVVAGLPIAVVEGQTFTRVVARFTDGDPLPNSESNYTATIRWGDGTPDSIGTVRQAADGNGFEVVGTHAFARFGAPNVVVTVREGGGNIDTATVGAQVTDAPITAVPTTLFATEGRFTGAVATLIDANPLGVAADFTATITVAGNPTPIPATVVADPGGGFQVVATNLALPFGDAQITATVTSLGGQQTQATSTATVTDAPIAIRSVPVIAVEGNFSGVVAQFTDANPFGRADEFLATIDWGDGVVTPGFVIPAFDGSPGFFVQGAHPYRVGQFPVRTTVLSVNGSQAASQNTATIADAPIAAQAVTVAVGEVLQNNGVLVASFVDGNPQGLASEFTATINWGDGTTTTGQVVPIAGTRPGSFQVVGDHAYPVGGTFATTVTIASLTGGAPVTVAGQAIVTDLFVPIAGGLAPGSDSGVSPFDNVTTLTQPIFSGLAAQGSTVVLIAQGGGLSTPTELGRATADPVTGAFTVASPALADGRYTVIARAFNRAGRPTSPDATLTGTAPLVIDTTGPQVANVQLEAARGQLRVTVRDTGGGLSPLTLANPFNYALTVGGRTIFPTGVALGAAAGDSQQVIVTFNNGRRLAGGNYVTTLSGVGLGDAAGNPLSERFFVTFPAINVRPGSNFVAQIDQSGRVSQFIPRRERLGADAFRRFLAARTFPRARARG